MVNKWITVKRFRAAVGAAAIFMASDGFEVK
jgi:hypothetical protein